MTETTTETETDDEQFADQQRTGSDSGKAETRSDTPGETGPETGDEAELADATDGTEVDDATAGSENAIDDDLRSTEIWRYLVWGALGVCSLLALFAVIQFYGSVTDAIDLWVEPRYRPLMHAAFNLVVLLGSLVGVSLLVRELS